MLFHLPRSSVFSFLQLFLETTLNKDRHSKYTIRKSSCTEKTYFKCMYRLCRYCHWYCHIYFGSHCNQGTDLGCTDCTVHPVLQGVSNCSLAQSSGHLRSLREINETHTVFGWVLESDGVINQVWMHLNGCY